MWLHAPGEMPEWSIGAVSKTVVRVTGPRVRIPISPQSVLQARAVDDGSGFYFMMTTNELAHEEKIMK